MLSLQRWRGLVGRRLLDRCDRRLAALAPDRQATMAGVGGSKQRSLSKSPSAKKTLCDAHSRRWTIVHCAASLHRPPAIDADGRVLRVPRWAAASHVRAQPLDRGMAYGDG